MNYIIDRVSFLLCRYTALQTRLIMSHWLVSTLLPTFSPTGGSCFLIYFSRQWTTRDTPVGQGLARRTQNYKKWGDTKISATIYYSSSKIPRMSSGACVCSSWSVGCSSVAGLFVDPITGIVPNNRVRPIWWTYANVCIRSRMIRNIHLEKKKKLFFEFFFLIFIISHKQKTHTHTHSLSHARTDRYSLSLSLFW